MTALWERPGWVLPICGPGGGLDRITLRGRDCDMCRSGHNTLVAQLCCAHWGRGGVIVAVPTV